MSKLNDDQFGPLQREWLEALESGRYKQTSENLRDNKGFCCLGVACDLTDPNVWDEDDELGNFSWNQEDTALPLKIMERFAFVGTMGEPQCTVQPGNPNIPSLAHMNDYGATFADIAAAVRDMPRRYFTEPK